LCHFYKLYVKIRKNRTWKRFLKFISCYNGKAELRKEGEKWI